MTTLIELGIVTVLIYAALLLTRKEKLQMQLSTTYSPEWLRLLDYMHNKPMTKESETNLNSKLGWDTDPSVKMEGGDKPCLPT